MERGEERIIIKAPGDKSLPGELIYTEGMDRDRVIELLELAMHHVKGADYDR